MKPSADITPYLWGVGLGIGVLVYLHYIGGPAAAAKQSKVFADTKTRDAATKTAATTANVSTVAVPRRQ